jgi:hypothetical protein
MLVGALGFTLAGPDEIKPFFILCNFQPTSNRGN